MKDWIKIQPKAGRGQIKRISEHLGVSTTLVSQVLSDDKHFSLETAAEVTNYLCFNESESEYFLLLVDYERAGSFKLKKILEKKIEKEQREALQLVNRLGADRKLSTEDKMQFYSNWIYSGIRILSALPEAGSAKEISQKLNLPLHLTNEALDFLLQTGLCVKTNNRITFGPLRTHIGKDTPFVVKHHQNWRIKAFQSMELRRDADLHFTQPTAMSIEAAEKIRMMLPEMIENILNIAGPSESEVVRCFNLDWFDYSNKNF